MYSKETWATDPGSYPNFTVSLEPGEGKLFRIKQWWGTVEITHYRAGVTTFVDEDYSAWIKSLPRSRHLCVERQGRQD